MTPDPMTTEQIDEVERYHALDLTHRDRLRLHLAEDEQGDDWDWERPLDEDLLSEMDTLAHALASAWERLEEREADMHLRIRQGYDKTAADTWREHCAEITTRAEAAERRVAELEAPGECQSIHKLQARIAELDRENLDLASQANASDAEARRRWETLETVVDQRDEARAALEASRERERVLAALLSSPGVRAIAEARVKHAAKGFDAEHDSGHSLGECAIVGAACAVYHTDAVVEDPHGMVEDGFDVWGLMKRHGYGLPLLAIAGSLIAADYDNHVRALQESP
jgi:hypothetical protein